VQNYKTVADRCMVDLSELQFPIRDDQVLEILERKGFSIFDVDIASLIRDQIGSRYRRGARLFEAPEVFDCSSFTKWVYAQLGIWLPRRSIQQRTFGEEIPVQDAKAGDLIFKSGWIDYYDTDPADGVGHVGIHTGEGTVVHAANRKLGVIESPDDKFTREDKFRGIRRLIPRHERVFFLKTPREREVEISDDIRWIVLQNL